MSKPLNILASSAPLGAAPSVVNSSTHQFQAPLGAACEIDVLCGLEFKIYDLCKKGKAKPFRP